jgi:hypothetical protein
VDGLWWADEQYPREAHEIWSRYVDALHEFQMLKDETAIALGLIQQVVDERESVKKATPSDNPVLRERSCLIGLTKQELAALMTDRLPEFWQWMLGQTMGVCEGEKCGKAHGVVAYSHDVERFLMGLGDAEWAGVE